jgi:hypothetical protein
VEQIRLRDDEPLTQLPAAEQMMRSLPRAPGKARRANLNTTGFSRWYFNFTTTTNSKPLRTPPGFSRWYFNFLAVLGRTSKLRTVVGGVSL